MSNTSIQILRSYVTSVPPALNDGELAYSFASDTMFIGDRNNEIIVVGGQYYANIVNTATTQENPNSLVLRDTNGNINISTLDGGNF